MKFPKSLPFSTAINRVIVGDFGLSIFLSSAKEVVMSDLPNDLIIQKKGPDLTWNDMLETWASKELVNGEDHILNSTVPIFEKTLIKVALKASKGKKSEAAKLLGWGRNTLARKMQELDF